MKLLDQAAIIVAFSEKHINDEIYFDFFSYNDLGVPLALSMTLGYIKLKDAGMEIISETWLDLCSKLNADPQGKYETLEDLVSAGKTSLPKIDIQRSIDLNNDGHQAFKTGNAKEALRLWKLASDLGQPNSITSLVWLNTMLNKFDELDSILFGKPELEMPGYGDRTENWRAQYDALAGDPSIGAAQFDGQKEMIFYNSALSSWLSGDEYGALAFLVLAGDGAEAKFLRSTINSVAVSDMELDKDQVEKLIDIYEKGIKDFQRIKSFDASQIQPWDGMTFIDFANASISALKTFTSEGEPIPEVLQDLDDSEQQKSDGARLSFGEFADLMQSIVDGEGDITSVAKEGIRIFAQHEELEDHEEDGWDLESLWFDVVEENIVELLDRPGSLSNSDLLDAILLLSEHDSHLLCLLLVQDSVRNQISQEILRRISDSEPCGHDNGRSDSCIGWPIRLALHGNTPVDVLSNLNDYEDHSDADSVKWALALNPSTPISILQNYATSDSYGWRIQGEIEEFGISEISIDEVSYEIQSFLRWAVAGNPSLPVQDRQALASTTASEIKCPDSVDVELLSFEIRKRATETR